MVWYAPSIYWSNGINASFFLALKLIINPPITYADLIIFYLKDKAGHINDYVNLKASKTISIVCQ